MSDEVRQEMIRALMKNLGHLDQMWARAVEVAESLVRHDRGEKMKKIINQYRENPEELREASDEHLAMTSWLAGLALIEASQRLGDRVTEQLKK